MDIVKYSGGGWLLSRIQIWLKTWKSQMIERLVRITKIGFNSGTVTSRKTRQAPAPSVLAASTSSRGTCVSPAKTISATNGIAPQTTSEVMTTQPDHVLANQS